MKTNEFGYHIIWKLRDPQVPNSFVGLSIQNLFSGAQRAQVQKVQHQ